MQEQKLSDIAGCVADVLRCTAGDTGPAFLEGRQYLDILLQKLSSIRGRESRYLKPLLRKMDGLAGYDINNQQQTLPLPVDTPMSGGNDYLAAAPGLGQRLSIAESVGMLRSLSMSGNLGMPLWVGAAEEWQPRRPSGRGYMYDDLETTSAMGIGGGAWNIAGGIAQAV